jgi:PAS domain S-box-containing protein
LAAVETDIQSWRHQPSGSTIYLDRLLEYAPIAVVALDTEGRIQAWNRRAVSMFGYGEREVLGTPLAKLFPAPEQKKLGRFLAGPTADEAALEPIVLQLQRASGELLFVQCTAGPLSGRTGEAGSLIMLQDVTQRMEAEQALQETLDRLEDRVLQRTAELARANAALEKSNIELQQFAHVASHDLQEPLRMVASFCQLLQRRYRGQLDEQADEYIDFAVSGAKRLQALIQDLLTYSSVDGKSNPFQPTDCGTLVDKVVADLTASIQDAGASVRRGNLPTVMGDNSQLAQVFRNLISNAVKYHGDAPCQVDVSASQNGEQWVFAVRDNGIGIAPQHQARIFDVFTRLHSPQEYPGTGIGLAICKRVVEHHGGQICLDSKPGKGTTFFFTIPVMSAGQG